MDTTFADLRAVDLIDIVIVAGLCWVAIIWAREARARVALAGVAVIALLFAAADWLDLRLLTTLLQGFIAIAALVLVVVFQEDLRRFFEGITLWVTRNVTPRPSRDVLDDLGALCFSLAARNVGALFVFPGREPLDRLLDGGQYLDGRVSEPLLESLLDPGTPGHDGGIVIRGGQVARFGVHLPLSTEWSEIGAGGTRHAAALGLAERSDAFCIVVSEERGEVSIACRARLIRISNASELRSQVEAFLGRTARRRREPWLESRLALARQHWREGLLAIGITAGLWVHTVPGAALDRSSKAIPIVVDNVPEGYRVSAIEPAAIGVEFEGRRRDLVMASDDRFQVHVDGEALADGRRTMAIAAEQVEHPPELRVVAIEPIKVRLQIEAR